MVIFSVTRGTLHHHVNPHKTHAIRVHTLYSPGFFSSVPTATITCSYKNGFRYVWKEEQRERGKEEQIDIKIVRC